MGLETGTGIGDLVPTNPLSTDAVSSGDDHIRLIKTVMQSITFLKSIQTFTATGTWTRPTNVRKIIIYCIGGGAGGGGSATSAFSGGGGSSGGVGIKWLDVSAIASATVTIGLGGAGGAVPSGIASAGNDTSFVTAGSVTQCLGYRGIAGTGSQFNGIPAPLTNSVGDIRFAGVPGGGGVHSPVAANGAQGGGSGAGTLFGPAQANSGGGGGGGYCDSAQQNPGTAGGSGYCVVFEFGW